KMFSLHFRVFLKTNILCLQVLNSYISFKLAASSGRMTETSKNFSKNAQNQAAIAEEITATIEEISAGVENVANNAEYQYNDIVQFADQTSTLSELISKMEDKINNALQRTLGIKEHAKSGSRQLDEMNDSIGTISQSSGEMTGIVNIIKEISDQINLLSLNAAIEAARAGDAGRGFAVVADEISKLADRTSSSVKEIETLINANEREIQKGKGNVEQTVATMSGIIQGVDEINTMVGLLAEFMQQQSQVNAQVMSTSNEVKKRAEEIRNASEEQKNASSEIVKSISGINELTQANASGALVLAESSEDILVMSEILEKQVAAIDVE
ncbi:MAG: methyl-accepting chemotaxis protein, partial [Spirochaetota bacterium]